MIDRGRPVGSGDVGGVDGFAGVHDVGHITAVGVCHVVVDGLQAAIG